MSELLAVGSVEEMVEAGRRFAEKLTGGEMVSLDGELGAGKTHFVKGIANAMGYEGEVTSPTFTLLHEYGGGRLTVLHADLYRLGSEEEVERAGIIEGLGGDAVLVVEWGGKFPGLFGRETVHVDIAITGETSRELRIRRGSTAN